MSIEEYRSSRKNCKIKTKIRLKKGIRNFINKLLVTTIVILLGLIITNKDAESKELINKFVYTDTFNFIKIKDVYNKYFGKYIGVDTNNDEKVFNEKISYNEINKYKDGVKLNVSNNYLVPTIEAGIVIFIGEKEGLGQTIIVEQIDGVNTWYSNINIKDVKIYDYVKKGALIGETIDNKLYLTFEKEGKFLDYKKFI